MVSSANLSPGTMLTSQGNMRMLNVDFSKDFSQSLRVETSVEYDLPAHIYPPKGSAPILMIHPNPHQVFRTTKSSPVATNYVSKPLSSLQIHSNSVVPNSHKVVSKPRVPCHCGNPSCNSVGVSRVPSVRTQNPTTSRHISQIHENLVACSSKSDYLPVLELKPVRKQSKTNYLKQFEMQQAYKAQLERQLQYETATATLQAQVQAQAKQQLHQIQQQKSNAAAAAAARQKSEQMAWNLSVPQPTSFPCCQHKMCGSVPTSIAHSEFLPPGIPPSVLARTPSRGTSGGSPKLRARSRRGLSLASSVHLPEYLGSAVRSSRTANAALSSHARTRSASMLVSAPSSQPPTSALDVVRVLTPRSIFAPPQQLQSGPQSTLLSTIVGQSRDSGCSLSAENLTSGATSSETTPDWAPWNVVDSGFCTPVDQVEDQIMEPLNTSSNPFLTPSSSLVNSLSFHKDTTPTTLNWMKTFQSPSLSNPALGKLHHPFVPQANHYIPQTIWNLAY